MASSTSFSIEGAVVKVHPPRTFHSERSGRDFTTRDIELDTAGTRDKSANVLCVTLFSNRCHLADNLNIGERIQVDGTIRGRYSEKSGRWYSSLEAQSIITEGT